MTDTRAREHRARGTAKAASSHEQHTRGLEAAYLAGAQSRQAAVAQQAIEDFTKLSLKDFSATDPIDLTALVELESKGERSLFFIGPCKGGLEIQQNGCDVLVLTPQAPLGQQLVGRKQGDRFKWGEGRFATECRIIGVS